MTKKCSLTETEALKLGEIRLKIESSFSSVRDIEWGIENHIIYLFQSRPVTNLESYTEWELTYELDYGHNDQNEYNTRANVGGVMSALSRIYS